ncbi:MAG: SRPBCC family protein [Actinomycetota bacterium]|nr:SRPBCC family protein [Actinomycetota bacterium]
MIRIEFTLAIGRPPEDVFELLSDIERLPEWQSSAVEAHTDGPLAEGSRIAERRRLLGREVDSQVEVVAYEPPRRLTLRSLGGPVKFTVDHELLEDARGTQLRFAAEAEPGTFMKLAEPLLARTAEQEFRKDFERLKELLEARPA